MLARVPGSAHLEIPLPDGEHLAATVYLPDRAPAPCLLEALPYRKDDLTASYRPEYRRFQDEYGYAVARVDVRGTGSSSGRAVDEYPAQEQADLAHAIGWLAGQDWCDGTIGMFGTSYSGFNSLQVAAERPPALRAVVATYSSDDRYHDDVHYQGGLLKLLDQVDYPLYMLAMNALPPVPARWGAGWRLEWERRVAEHEPWLLGWLEEQHAGSYWAHGSLRPAYDRIRCPTMLVGGWADGYRNNTFRTVEALSAAGVPVRLLLGPWGHQAPASALPGPPVDLVAEMARWWDRWLRGRDVETGPPITVFVRRSTRPAPDLAEMRGQWRAEPGWPLDRVRPHVLPLGSEPVGYDVRPDVGTAAWISCAGALPYGQPTDQRFDDAASLTWELPVDEPLEILGQPRLRVRLAATAPVGTLAVRLCDVFADGTSALVTRGTLNLCQRNGPAPEPLPVGEYVDAEVELEATSWVFESGQRLRLALAGADWPNTVAPPRPLQLTIDLARTELVLPVVRGPGELPAPVLTQPAPAAPDPVPGPPPTWRVEHDVLGRRTACVVGGTSTSRLEDGTLVHEAYDGRVEVDLTSFVQRAQGRAEFRVDWLEESVRSLARLDLRVTATAFDVTLELEAGKWSRRWERSIPRRLG